MVFKMVINVIVVHIVQIPNGDLENADAREVLIFMGHNA